MGHPVGDNRKVLNLKSLLPAGLDDRRFESLLHGGRQRVRRVVGGAAVLDQPARPVHQHAGRVPGKKCARSMTDKGHVIRDTWVDELWQCGTNRQE